MAVEKKNDYVNLVISILIPLLFGAIFYIISGITELKANMTSVKSQVNRIEEKFDTHIMQK
jgi:hypothetical protein